LGQIGSGGGAYYKSTGDNLVPLTTKIDGNLTHGDYINDFIDRLYEDIVGTLL